MTFLLNQIYGKWSAQITLPFIVLINSCNDVLYAIWTNIYCMHTLFISVFFNYYIDVMLFSLSLTGIWKTTEFNSFPATFLRWIKNLGISSYEAIQFYRLESTLSRDFLIYENCMILFYLCQTEHLFSFTHLFYS